MADFTGPGRNPLEPIFSPQSVAVVGTTRVPGTVPFDIFHNILKDDFQGTIYPVSPRERSIAGVKAYKYVLDIPDPFDLAVIGCGISVVMKLLPKYIPSWKVVMDISSTVLILGLVTALSLYILVRMLQGAKQEIAAKKGTA